MDLHAQVYVAQLRGETNSLGAEKAIMCLRVSTSDCGSASILHALQV